MKKKITVWWKSLAAETRTLIAVCVISTVAIGIASLKSSWAEKPASAHSQVPGLDTFIPKGFVLVPIEVQNYEALDSILGKFGLVDLFKTKADGGGPIARNVRILRAPQNPSRFAVLVEEARATNILTYQGGIFVVVKPMSQAGTEFVKTAQRTQRKIVFEGD
jgi:hypothetical protein